MPLLRIYKYVMIVMTTKQGERNEGKEASPTRYRGKEEGTRVEVTIVSMWKWSERSHYERHAEGGVQVF